MTSLKSIFIHNKWRITFITVFTLFNSIIVNHINASPKYHPLLPAETPLKAFEGIYQSKENEFMVYQITVQGDKLLAQQFNGDAKLTLTRKAEFEFEFPDNDGDEKIPVVFSKNESGEISQITLGGRQIWTKIKSYTPPKEVQLKPEQIRVLAGKYQSDERADLFLTITAIPDGLTLKQSWDGKEINFKPISDLLFLNQPIGFPLKFTKDASGNTTKVLAFNRDTWNKVKE